MKKIFALIAITFISLSALANGVEILGIYYILDNSNYTASVTYTSEYYYSDNTYSGAIDIPDGFYYEGLWYNVTSIGDYAFYGCLSLTSVTITQYVTSIGRKTFSWCPQLSSIIVAIENPIYDSRMNCNAIIESSTNTLVAGCKNTIIPDNVEHIGDEAFYLCSGLISITIPESIQSIGRSAFDSCRDLISIDLSTCKADIEKNAFGDCCSLSSILIPKSIKNIGSGAFAGCKNLASIIVEDGNPVYDSRYNCNAIIESASNTLIAGCQNTHIPSDALSIGSYAFMDCDNLTNIMIPSSIVNIGSCAFMGCENLYSLTLPSSITNIGSSAFDYCTSITSILCLAITPPYLGENDVFAPSIHGCPLYVHASSVLLYQAADQWREFDIQPILVEIDHITSNTTELTWEPVESASLYQLHIYTDSTSSIVLDTTLLIHADSLNGGIMLQTGISEAHRAKKIIQDAVGTIIVITIDPASGTSAENPYTVTVSTTSGERIDVHYNMTVYQGEEILREESGTFVFNESVTSTRAENTLAPSLSDRIYDLQGRQYSISQYPALPAGIYIIRKNNKVIKQLIK